MILTTIFTLLSALYDNGKRFVDHRPRFIFRAIVAWYFLFVKKVK